MRYTYPFFDYIEKTSMDCVMWNAANFIKTNTQTSLPGKILNCYFSSQAEDRLLRNPITPCISFPPGPRRLLS